jgi:outer membrane protein OmpA-like peptidoglycan-associated protein
VINTKYEEHTPFISSNDSILFFSSQGHASIGGVDVFYSELNDQGEWGEPVNIGYPVNTTGEDLFFNPGWDELDGFYAVRRESDPTTNAINMVIELEPEPEPMAAGDVKEDSMEVVDVSEEVDDVLVEAKEEIVSAEPDKDSTELQMDILTVIEPEVTDDVLEVLNKPRIVEEPKETREPEMPVVPPVEGPVTLLTGIPFDFNNFELNIPALLEVEKVAELMHNYPHSLAKLTGHTDASGDPDYNMLLSLQRANIIADYLEMRGIPEERISISGAGEDAPIARNYYPDGKAAPLGRYLNRQVSVLVSGNSPIESNLKELYIPLSLRPDSTDSEPYSYWFTIQILADLKPIDASRFEKYPHVVEHQCKDGYYRYTLGKYNDFLEARSQLNKIRRSGFKDAYIQTVEYYRKACE